MSDDASSRPQAVKRTETKVFKYENHTSKATTIAQQLLMGACSSGTATTITHPVDVLKVRLQIQRLNSTAGGFKYEGGGLLATGRDLLKREGPVALFKGLDAAYIRALTYSGTRLGLYDPMKDVTGARENPTLPRMIGAGVIAGSIAAFIANPVEMTKVRMQACKSGKSSERRYKNVVDAFRTIFKEEGVAAFYAGLVPHVGRGASITASQVVTYDYLKHQLLDRGLMEEGLSLHFVSSMCAGVMTTTASSPFDVVKTTMMNHSNPHITAIECVTDILKREGALGLLKGWLPNYARLGPQTLITFVVYEKLREWMGMKPV